MNEIIPCLRCDGEFWADTMELVNDELYCESCARIVIAEYDLLKKEGK